MSDKSIVSNLRSNMAELTVKSLVLGTLLGVLMCASNAYLGLYAGMTVSASIPAAVISMAILRGVLKRGTILENNIVQAMASAGESMAAGIIFTVPALVLVGAWTKFEFWPTLAISVCGGVIGVIFTVPLRRVLIVEEKELKYPEGVACAEVLEVGETGGANIRPIAYGLMIGALVKFFNGGVMIFKSTVEFAGRIGGSLFVFGCDLSPALFGVGYIINIEIAVLIFLGGAIGWFVGIPIMSSDPSIANLNGLDAAWTLWSTKVRYLGVGAMLVGGLWSIFNIRQGIVKGLKRVASGFSKVARDKEKLMDRTDMDMDVKYLTIALAISLVVIFFLYYYLTGAVGISILTTIIMVVASFFLVAVSVYIVGLVGSSNSPTSGLIICALLGSSVLFLMFGFKGMQALVATLGVAGVTCCAAASATDMAQDLKTGQLVGATPSKMQFVQMLSIIVSSFTLPIILTVLHNAYGIGTGLKAPQATLFASIVKGIFEGTGLPWNMVFIGMGIGVVVIIIDIFLKKSGSRFRAYVMPLAVGIYLPLSLSTPIFLGGIMKYLIVRRKGGVETSDGMHDYGVLLSSGLIAGESLMGVVIAFLIGAKIGFPFEVFGNSGVSSALFAIIIIAFYKLTINNIKKHTIS